MNNKTPDSFNPAYIGQRPDIESLVSPKAKSVLDVGCSVGSLGAAIKQTTGARVVGIELSEEMASYAKQRIDEVFVGDAANIILSGKLDGQQFDTIIFADVLEHLNDPWAVLKRTKDYLVPNGEIVASIPNIRHIDTLYNLVVKGYWPYRERGIHDSSHLRFFTKRNIFELFQNAGLVIEQVETHYRIIERPHNWNRFAKYFAILGLKEFFAFQYLVRARVKTDDKS